MQQYLKLNKCNYGHLLHHTVVTAMRYNPLHLSFFYVKCFHLNKVGEAPCDESA